MKKGGIACRYTPKKPFENTLANLASMAASPSMEWERRLNFHTKGVADVMADIHGGRYNIVVNHETCLVMVVRVFERPAL